MIVPTKFTSLDDSVLAKTPVLLQNLVAPVSVLELYSQLERRFEDIGEFMLALDILFVLGEVVLNKETEMLEKC